MKRLVNAITCTRFVFALILVLAAPGSAWFWAAYGLGAVSDVLDGLLARRFGVQSDGGARLDSAADIAFLLALTAALLRARQLACWLLYAAGAVLLIRSVTYAAGFYKFRTFVSLYTTLNRAAGVVLVGYPVLVVLLGQGTAAWLAAAAAGLSALEELELVLRAWTPAPDVRGLLWIEKPRRRDQRRGFASRETQPQMAFVSRAMTSSSFVGMTNTLTLESGVEIMMSSPRLLLASGSIVTPR